MAEKVWEGCDGLEVTEEMKLTVSAQAALLLLGMPHDYFSQVPSIVLFPHSFAAPPGPTDDPRYPRIYEGQAHPHGAVFLSWKEALAEGRDPGGGRNVVIHEFAHQLDFMDGYFNGMPNVAGRKQTLRWQEVMTAAFSQLRQEIASSRKSFLGDYAGSNPTEFFSVASEKFFLLPKQFREHHPELYEVLSEYYGVDPSKWFGAMLRDSDFMDVTCPSCGSNLSFLHQSAERFQECPRCSEAVLLRGSKPETGNKISMPIQTARLLLRRFNPRDYQALCEVMQDDEGLRALDWESMKPHEIETWLDQDAEIRFPQRDKSVCLAIERTTNAAFVGLATLRFRDYAAEQLKFTVLVLPRYRRQGYGFEVVRALLAFGFGDLDVHRVTASCDVQNQAARDLVTKAGLRLEGEAKLDRRVRGEWISTASFALLKEEFLSAKAAGLAR